MEAKQWGFPYGDVEAYVDAPPGHARNKFIVIGDELNHVAYIPSIHPEAKEIAFLVKAAPDLLTALNLYIRLDNDRRAGCKIAPADWAECHQAAMSAIAQARGEV